MPAAQVDIGISCHESARPADTVMAKSRDSCAVVGQVCWFCLKSEPQLSRSRLDNTYGSVQSLAASHIAPFLPVVQSGFTMREFDTHTHVFHTNYNLQGFTNFVPSCLY